MISNGTAWEIARHPLDLFFSLEPATDFLSPKYGIAICRGEEHRYKPLLASEGPDQLFPNREEALQSIQWALYLSVIAIPGSTTVDWATPLTDLAPTDHLSFVRAIVEDCTKKDSSWLNLDQVDLIIDQLDQTGSCKTIDLLS